MQTSWPCDSAGVDDWCDVWEITVGWWNTPPVPSLGIDDMLVAVGGVAKQFKSSAEK